MNPISRINSLLNENNVIAKLFPKEPTAVSMVDDLEQDDKKRLLSTLSTCQQYRLLGKDSEGEFVRVVLEKGGRVFSISGESSTPSPSSIKEEAYWFAAGYLVGFPQSSGGRLMGPGFGTGAMDLDSIYDNDFLNEIKSALKFIGSNPGNIPYPEVRDFLSEYSSDNRWGAAVKEAQADIANVKVVPAPKGWAVIMGRFLDTLDAILEELFS